MTVWDKWNVSEPFSFTVSIVLYNDPPQLRFTDPNLTFDWLRQSSIQLVPSDATLFDADNHLMVEAYLSFVHKRSGDVIDVDDFEAVGIQKYRLANGDIVMNGTSNKENYLAVRRNLSASYVSYVIFLISGYQIDDVYDFGRSRRLYRGQFQRCRRGRGRQQPDFGHFEDEHDVST